MVFSSPTDKSGIVEEIDFLVKSNSITYPIEDKTRNINKALDRVAFLIQTADKTWQWEDKNQPTLPIATTDLVIGQRDYEIDTTFLEVLKVAVMDTTGFYREIPQVDISDPVLGARNIVEDNTNQAQTNPIRYDLMGSNIFLDPIPNYNATNGLKVFFKRNIQYFTPSDTTKEAGFNLQFHRYLSLSASYDFAVAEGLDKANTLRQEMINMENALVTHYSRRNKDRPTIISFRPTRSW